MGNCNIINFTYKVYSKFFLRKVEYIKGKRYLQKTCTDSKKYYIVTSHGIGDVAWMCVYLKGFLNANNIIDEKVVILTQKKMYGIISLFYPQYLYKYCEKNELINVQMYLSNTKKVFNNIKLAIFPMLKPSKIGWLEFDLLSRTGADMDLLYKIGCFSIPKCTAQIPQIQSFQSNKRKKIVLVPYVNSRNKIPIKLWNEIVLALKKYDIDIYTNCENQDQCLDGTELLRVDLKDIPKVIGDDDLVIGGRCGLMDWLFIAQKNIIVLHSIIKNYNDKFIEARNNFASWESFEIIKKNNFDIFNQKFVKDIRLEIEADETADINELLIALQGFYGDEIV